MTVRGPAGSAWVVVAVGAALYLAARTTGAGWLIVLMCGLAGVLTLAAIWPRLALSNVRVEASGPADATAGEPFEVVLRVTRAGLGARLRPFDPPGDWTAVVDGNATRATMTPTRRGIVTEMTVEASSGAPFGLIWWRRRITARLARPIDVAPRRGAASLPDIVSGAADGETGTGGEPGGDRVRTVREYRPGDPMRLVHWPASARRGEVLVKELEHPRRPRVAVVVDLRGGTDAAERAAETALGVAATALESGLDVDLHTHEASGPRSAAVTSVREAGRRLARATAGAPPAPGAGSQVIRIAGDRL